jgi:hypothetical protein
VKVVLTRSDVREGVDELGRAPGEGLDRRLWRGRWLLFRRGVTGWSALVAVAFSVLGKPQEPIPLAATVTDED